MKHFPIAPVLPKRSEPKDPRVRPMNEKLFHGTQERFVYSLMTQGFRLDKQMWGRGWGNGVYLSGTKEFASMWGSILLVCQLKKGARIVWHTDYDRKIIAYLKREFGSGISEPDFWKIVPRKKQLKKEELIAVWNYLLDTCYEGKRRFQNGRLDLFQKNYAWIYTHLKRHQIDGVGFTKEEWPEVLVFNPSVVHPVSVHWWNSQEKDISPPLSLHELKTIQERAEVEWCQE